MTEPTTHTFQVAEDFVGETMARIKKATTRAAAKGYPSPVATWGTPHRVRKITEDGWEYFETLHPLALTFSAPMCFSGWSLMARIEHDKTVGTLVHDVPGVTFDLSAYRNAAPVCAHCKTARKRNDTFVLRHEDGRLAQIGRSCIKDFLGHNPTEMVAFFRELRELEDDIQDFMGRPASPSVDLAKFGAVVVHLLRTEGFRPSSFENATRNVAWTCLYPPSGFDKAAVALRAFATKTTEAITDQDRAYAADAIARWTRISLDGEGLSDFEANVAKIFHAGVIAQKHTGLAAAGFHSHMKALGLEAERKAAALASNYVGTKGSRIEVKATVTNVFSFDTHFGPKHINKLVDEAGNVFVWKTATYCLDKGKTYGLKCTIKDHEEYVGRNRDGANLPAVKQTILARCVILSPADAHAGAA